MQAGAKELGSALATAQAIQALQPKLPLGYYLAGLVQQRAEFPRGQWARRFS